VNLAKSTTVEDVNAAIKAASEGPLKGVLGYNTLPLVSIDYNHCPNSSTFDAPGTKLIEGDFLRIMTWYDNEWGFSNRMLDTAVEMSKHF
jgi:glyceraldehyde 3-phosphate dehydrogenase